jgi:hypothetical protein
MIENPPLRENLLLFSELAPYASSIASRRCILHFPAMDDHAPPEFRLRDATGMLY